MAFNPLSIAMQSNHGHIFLFIIMINQLLNKMLKQILNSQMMFEHCFNKLLKNRLSRKMMINHILNKLFKN